MRFGMRSIAAMLMVLALGVPTRVNAQVGKSQGVVDANTAAEKDLAEMPHMTPAIASALVAARPFKSIVDLNTFLVGQGLKPEDAMEFYQQGVRAHRSEHGDAGGDSAGARSRQSHGSRVRRVPAVEVVGAIRQGDWQVRRPRGHRAAGAILLHPGQSEHRQRRGHPHAFRRRARAWFASSRNTGRGSRGRSSTRRSASTSARRKPID